MEPRPVCGIWASQSTKDEMPQQDLCIWTAAVFSCKKRVRRWNGAIFSCSTKASNSFAQNARQIETGRSGKGEAKKWLYKIQPLRQQKAIAIWPSASEHGYSIHEAKRHSLDYTFRISLRSTAFQRSVFNSPSSVGLAHSPDANGPAISPLCQQQRSIC